jgi:hypothetical protein
VEGKGDRLLLIAGSSTRDLAAAALLVLLVLQVLSALLSEERPRRGASHAIAPNGEARRDPN